MFLVRASKHYALFSHHASKGSVILRCEKLNRKKCIFVEVTCSAASDTASYSVCCALFLPSSVLGYGCMHSADMDLDREQEFVLSSLVCKAERSWSGNLSAPTQLEGESLKSPLWFFAPQEARDSTHWVEMLIAAGSMLKLGRSRQQRGLWIVDHWLHLRTLDPSAPSVCLSPYTTLACMMLSRLCCSPCLGLPRNMWSCGCPGEDSALHTTPLRPAHVCCTCPCH